jgi:hypothetical protein
LNIAEKAGHVFGQMNKAAFGEIRRFAAFEEIWRIPADAGESRRTVSTKKMCFTFPQT